MDDVVVSSTTAPLLRVEDLRKTFGHYRWRGSQSGSRQEIQAVDGVDIQIDKGMILGLVGESGSGKSTLARCIAGVYPPTSGRVLVDDRPLPSKRGRSDLRKIQMIFQDPQSALNPRMTVRQTLSELLRFHRMVPQGEIEARCSELVDLVGLGGDVLDEYPRRLSGGQKQRVSTARALALEPEVLVADEPTSALDVSVQAAILELFVRLNKSLELTILFISHNMAVVRQISSRVAVMYLGRVVEEGETERVFATPGHPYTRVLLSAIPRVVPGRESAAMVLAGDPPKPTDIPSGCRFHPRCFRAESVCVSSDPELRAADWPMHLAACHFAWDIDSPPGISGGGQQVHQDPDQIS